MHMRTPAFAASIIATSALIAGCSQPAGVTGGERFAAETQQTAQTKASEYLQRVKEIAAENNTTASEANPAMYAQAERDGVIIDGRSQQNIQTLVNIDGTWVPVCIDLGTETSTTGVCPGADRDQMQQANQEAVVGTAWFYASEMDFAAAEGDPERRNEQTAEERIEQLEAIRAGFGLDAYRIEIDGTTSQVSKIWFAPDGTEQTAYACITAGNPGEDSYARPGTC